MTRSAKFGDWLVQPHLNQLIKDNLSIPLEPKAMDVLVLLLSRAGTVVSVEEILQAVWPQKVVEENAVHQRISKLRRALGDSSRSPRYIQNVPKRGYCTIAPVEFALHEDAHFSALPSGQLAGITPPFAAYSGPESYAFICYSHKDKEAVYQELRHLKDENLNIWYDEGLATGKAWAEELATAINNCSHFVYFATSNSINSTNCRDELQYAKQKSKPILMVHLDDAPLTDGLLLSTGSLQSIKKQNLTDSEFHRRILAKLSVVKDQQSLPRETRLTKQQHHQATEQDPVSTQQAGWKGQVGALNKWVLTGSGYVEYGALCLFGALPLFVAYTIGAWHDNTVPIDSAFYAACNPAPAWMSMQGLESRWNWLVYPVFLPFSLLYLRYMFRPAFGASANSPLLTEPSYEPIRRGVIGILDDWRPITFAALFIALVTAEAMSDVAVRLANPETFCPTGPMDWGWFANVFDSVPLGGMLVLTALTTVEQMLISTISIITVIYLVRFNLRYVSCIYLRSESTQPMSKYVLDLDDPDRRFGLGKLSKIFDLQLFACILGGLMALTSRYMNTNQGELKNAITNTFCTIYDFGSRCDPNALVASVYIHPREIVPDAIQWIIVLTWVVFLMFILWSGNIKLLPLKNIGEREGRRVFLRELILPGTVNDQLLASKNPDEVDKVARRFSEHEYWPTGDQRATDAVSLCAFIVLLLMFPIVPNGLFEWFAIGLFVLISKFVANTFIAVQRHMLARVDRSLTRW